MQAVRIHAHGDPSVLRVEQIPAPAPKPGEVLVRMLAVSLNHLDLWVRRGMPGQPISLPHIPGCDGTGEIVELGSGVREAFPGLFPGRRVAVEPGYSSGRSRHDLEGNDHLSDDYAIRGEHSDGLDCELVAIPARYALPLPDGLDPITAAAVPLTFLTAFGMLIHRARVVSGETVLVIAGASGVGSAAIQIARERGARVLATAGSEEKRALCRELGASAVFDHRSPSWGKEVRAATDGRGCDVVVEHVGQATWESSLRSLARNGRLVTCGSTTGATVSVLLPHLFIKNLSILGSTMGPRSCLPDILAGVARGIYRASVDEVLPLSAVARAHERLERGDVVGKLVLVPGK
jgi:NADPH:quinone reductase-like Zn-dependent oxidoreductase